MIQFILILLGLIFPNKATNATTSNVAIVTQNSFVNSNELVEDTSGETGQILPPKK
ncbi:hypothetical protein [Chryseobacterium sp. StRB126]|uniref:hypothetical protein n=1 Tax=Chryseobacterium sp. StRB126 TaxID=878220 RepID=UPI000A4C355B|nr:hypothetical protein [Chryseobacterium sp. StRB126]